MMPILAIFESTVFRSAVRFWILCAVLSSIVGLNVALADRQYRCFGRVQYRPCGQSYIEFEETKSNHQPSVAQKKSNPLAGGSIKTRRSVAPYFATVVKQSYRRLNHGMGEWTGVVRGLGNVHVKLAILRAGSIDEERYIGSVQLKKEKSTHFGFRSTVPEGSNWQAQVIAWAEPQSSTVFGRR